MSLEKIGRYQIIKELGRGGMATVYHANDPSFERDVAVKVLPRAFLHDPQFRARFEREAKTVAALEHSAIVPVYDFGEEDGQPYIVMRMMSGGDLADKLKQGSLDFEEAKKIINRLGASLDAAHAKGIIHRDLKPGNILFDQYNNAYLSDFGIARLAHGSHTLTGENIIGTPAYMSPEQVQGEKDIDGRSDLYSLGIIFYQMLQGNTPFQATTPAKVMMMHILEPVPDLAMIQPDIPPQVQEWLHKLLAKEPDDRFSSAKEMSEALEAASRGETHHTMATASRTILKDLQPTATAQTPPVAPVYGAPQSATTPPPMATPLPAPFPARPKRNWLPIAIGGFIIVGLGAIAILATAFMGYQGRGPLAMLASPTATIMLPSLTSELTPEITPQTEAAVVEETSPSPTEDSAAPTVEVAAPTEEVHTPTQEAPPTDSPPTATPEPTATETPSLPTIGGADKVAFIDNNDVFIMNIDGSDLQKLTNDGAAKTNLSWTPDGTGLTYISGKCVWLAEYESGRLDYIACFDSAEYFESFAISPDGADVAIALNRNLYIVPYDIETLRQARLYTHLEEMSKCPAFSPMVSIGGSKVSAKVFRWSDDGSRLSIMVLAAVGGGLQGDIIRIYDKRSCEIQSARIDEFPAVRFQVEDYDHSPYIQDFGYDGNYLYAFTSFTRNDGYGHLYLYNSELQKPEVEVNPIDGKCCYRDPEFSPDGRHIIVAYQPFEAGAISQIYIIPFGTIGTGATYEPISLPAEFFNNPKVAPQPVMRPISGSSE
jgi:serine/threonine protein kinase